MTTETSTELRKCDKEDCGADGAVRATTFRLCAMHAAADLIQLRIACHEIAGMMHFDAYEAWQTRNDGFPGDYWHGLGTPEDAHTRGLRVGASQAAKVAREALDVL